MSVNIVSKHCWKCFRDETDPGYDTERGHSLDYIYFIYNIYNNLKDIDRVSTFSNEISKRHRPYHDSTN